MLRLQNVSYCKLLYVINFTTVLRVVSHKSPIVNADFV